MSSCAASCCICFPKVSCASVTSASWPTANVPRPCHFAFSCSARDHLHKPSKRSPQPVRAIFGFAPSAVGRCWSSKGLRLRKSSSALHRPLIPSPHEITTNTTKRLPPSEDTLSLCFLVQQISSSSLTRSSSRSSSEFQSTLLLSLLAAACSHTSSVPH